MYTIPYSTKLWRSKTLTDQCPKHFGRENIGGLVIFSALEIDQVCVLLECFSKIPYLLQLSLQYRVKVTLK